MDFLHAHNGQRATLENGNTVICEALNGRVFEVNTNDEIVWDYVAPMHHYNEIFDAESNAMFRAYRGTLLVLQKFVAGCKTLKNISISL